MVFGNLGDDCATGVGLTRDCSMGGPGFNGDYLINAQGEDVVAGIRTPKLVEETLVEDAPDAFEQLTEIGQKLSHPGNKVFAASKLRERHADVESAECQQK